MQLEKACVQQRRPSTAKNKKIRQCVPVQKKNLLAVTSNPVLMTMEPITQVVSVDIPPKIPPWELQEFVGNRNILYNIFILESGSGVNFMPSLQTHGSWGLKFAYSKMPLLGLVTKSYRYCFSTRQVDETKAKEGALHSGPLAILLHQHSCVDRPPGLSGV